MAVSKETVQILVIVFFSILILGGIILLIAGSVFEAQTEKGSDYFESGFRAPAILFIVAGVLCLIGALLGLFGAILLGKWLLFVGVIFVFVALLCGIAGGILAYVKRNDKGMIDYDRLSADFMVYNEHKQEVDNVQKTFRCCGYAGGAVMTDFYPNDTQATTKPTKPLYRAPKFPKSCCRGEPSDCSPSHSDIYEGGCKTAMKSYLRNHGVVLLGVMILIAIFEILAIVFGLLFLVMFWGNFFKKAGEPEGGAKPAGGGAN